MKNVAAGLRRLWRRASGGLTLSQRFLVVAAALVAVTMLVLGGLISDAVTRGINEGMAATAANTIKALLSHELDNPTPQGPLTLRDESRVAQLFEISSDAIGTRLLQIRLYDLDGRVVYESADPLTRPRPAGEIAALATRGSTTAALKTIALAPVGPLRSLPLHALEILTPLRGPAGGHVVAVAEMEYSAEQVEAVARAAQVQVWTFVAITGVLLTSVLYVFVDSGSQVIARQRRRLTRNLGASRRLSARIRDLHKASENLRVNANLANEQLLAFVGSEIHDGPIQLLTLLILKLTGVRRARENGGAGDPAPDDTIPIATRVIEELRSISSGLVLPEVAQLSLRDVIDLAVSRHHALTGVSPMVTYGALPTDVSVEVKTCAYRIVQEALNNAFRHGEPDGQLVKADIVGREVLLEIANRRAAAVSDLESAPGTTQLGLIGMKFRAESVGGSLSVQLAESSLAKIVARLPVHSVEDVSSDTSNTSPN